MDGAWVQAPWSFQSFPYAKGINDSKFDVAEILQLFIKECFSIYSAVLAELCYVRAIDLVASNLSHMLFYMCSLV